MTVRMAAVGYGYWGPNLVRNLLDIPSCELVALCDADSSKLDLFHRRHPFIRTTTSFDELVDDESIDAMYIATPVSTHFRLASAALAAGKHVLLEKPIAASSEEAQTLTRLADERRRILMVGHTFLYSPPVMKIKQLLEGGSLGDLHYLDCLRVNLGLFQKDVSVLWDLGPHDLSILMYWLGSPPVSVSAQGRSYVGDGLEDVAFLTLEFPNSVLAQVQVSWLAPSKLRRITLVGSKRMVLYDDLEAVEKVKIFDRGVDKIRNPESFGEFQLTYRAGDIVSPKLENSEPLLLQCREFLDCVESGRQPRSSAAFAADIIEVVEAAERSMRSGGTPQKIGATLSPLAFH